MKTGAALDQEYEAIKAATNRLRLELAEALAHVESRRMESVEQARRAPLRWKASKPHSPGEERRYRELLRAYGAARARLSTDRSDGSAMAIARMSDQIDEEISHPSDAVSRMRQSQRIFTQQLEDRIPRLTSLLADLESSADQLLSYVAAHERDNGDDASGGDEQGVEQSGSTVIAKATSTQVLLDLVKDFYGPESTQQVERTPEQRQSLKELLTVVEGVRSQAAALDRLRIESARRLDSRTERWASIGPHTAAQVSHVSAEMAQINELSQAWREWVNDFNSRQSQAVAKFAERFREGPDSQIPALTQLRKDLDGIVSERITPGEQIATDISARRLALADFIDENLLTKSGRLRRLLGR